MIRGFVTGVAWGGVVAGLGLAVISQVAPKPQMTAEVAAVVTEAPAKAAAPVVPPVVTVQTAEEVEVPAVETPPVLVAPAAPEPVAPQPAAPQPAEAVLPPEVIASAEAPVAPVVDGSAAIPLPDLPAAVAPAAPTPDTPVAPDAVESGDPVASADLPPPAPDEALLVPAPTPTADPAPARIAPETGPLAEAAPVLPDATVPLPDAAPDLPIARPLPVPEVQPEVIATAPEVAEPVQPAKVLEPVDPIIAVDAPRTLAPDPGLPAAEGVKVGRLPRIGGTAEGASAADGEAGVDAVPADAPPLQRFARAFDNPDAKPLFSILLRDTGEANLDRAALAKISFPVTFVLDPMEPGAAEAARVYRRGGQEVLMLATGIPEGATPGDLEQTFQSLAGVLPEAVGVIDQATGGFQGNRPLAAQVVPILAELGRGLVTFDTGLNAADQEARRAGLPAAMIFRRLDAESEPTPTIRRYLDRAAFKAAQEGRVVVLGDTRPETVAALLEWAVEGRAASVALAPITAVLSAP